MRVELFLDLLIDRRDDRRHGSVGTVEQGRVDDLEVIFGEGEVECVHGLLADDGEFTGGARGVFDGDEAGQGFGGNGSVGTKTRSACSFCYQADVYI